MPPGRPPKRNRPHHPQSVPSPTFTSNPGVSSNADTPANHTLQSSSPPRSSTSLGSGGHDDHPRQLTPFLNTTFSTHRLSPLYIGSQPLTQDRLQALSHRLRDFLVGDVVRGVNLGLDHPADEGAMSRAGALEAVSISRLAPHRSEPDTYSARGGSGYDHQGGDPSGLSTSTGTRLTLLRGRTRGIQISLQYEYAECAALLLPSAEDVEQPSEDEAAAVDGAPSAPNPLLDFAPGKRAENDPAFLRLPLLLMRMPAPLKAAVISFLSRTFDCRVSSLSLGTRSLVRALEGWIGDMSAETHLGPVKDVVLTLGFYSPAVMQCRRRRQPPERQPHDMTRDKQEELEEEDDASDASESALGLKSIDLIIPGADLVRLVTAGKVREAAEDASAGQTQDRHKRAGAQGRDQHVEAKRRRLGGDKDEEGWTWRQRPDTSDDSGSAPQPFTDALAQYVLQHLALDMFHAAVRITKVACGGFVLSEGRIKIFGLPSSARAWGVLDVLLEKSRVETPWEKLRGKVVGLSS